MSLFEGFIPTNLPQSCWLADIQINGSDELKQKSTGESVELSHIIMAAFRKSCGREEISLMAKSDNCLYTTSMNKDWRQLNRIVQNVYEHQVIDPKSQ